MAVSVYIIDEHAAVRNNLVRRLASTDEIRVVGHSGEAISALREVRDLQPDVLLLEVKMKRADGVAVCSQAAALNKKSKPGDEASAAGSGSDRNIPDRNTPDGNTKVVVITSYFDTEERLEVQRAGASDYLLKDLDTKALVLRLTSLKKEPTTGKEPTMGSIGNGSRGGPMTTIREFAKRTSGDVAPIAAYSRVLVPLDGSEFSEQVLPYAKTLANALGANIDLVRIFHGAATELADPEHGHTDVVVNAP